MRISPPISVAAGFALALATGAPAKAYETLSELVRHVPEAPEGGVGELYFMSPRAMSDWPPSAWVGIGFDDFTDALLDPTVGIEMAGIDFTRLDGIANWGTPPFSLLYMIGDAVDPDAIGEVLLARGLEETERDGTTVYAIGEDREADLTQRDPGYPFGGGWRAHRVAVDYGVALLAFAWDDLEAGLDAAALSGDGAVQAMLEGMVQAASEGTPGGFVAHGAATLPTEAFVAPDGLPEDAVDPLPRFDAVMYIAAAGDDWEAGQIALAYADPDVAAAAAEELAARLQAFAGVADRDAKVIPTSVSLDGGGAVALATAIFPPGTPYHPSSALYSRMMSDAFTRRYQLLSTVGE